MSDDKPNVPGVEPKKSEVGHTPGPRWRTPQVLNDLDVAFPVDVMDLLPSYDEIPREFKAWPPRDKWGRLVSDWFYRGVTNLETLPKEGIDSEAALRHIKACLGLWQPKHEHKTAGVAYLLSLWFEDIDWKPVEEKSKATSR